MQVYTDTPFNASTSTITSTVLSFVYIILFIHVIYWRGRTHIFYMAFLWSSLVTSSHWQSYQTSSKSRYQLCLTVRKANKSNTFEVRAVRMIDPLIITALPLQREEGRACVWGWRYWPASLWNQTQSFWHQYINAKWFINTAGDEGTGLSIDSDRGGWWWSLSLFVHHTWRGPLVEFIVSLHSVIGGGSNRGPVCFPYIALCK